MSEVQISCPKCSADLLIDKEEMDALQGTTISCLNCNADILLPSLSINSEVAPQLCPSCGNAVISSAMFCAKCGTNLNDGTRLSPKHNRLKLRDVQENVISSKPTSYRITYGEPQDNAETSCSYCNNPLPVDAVICVHCGIDLRTGKRIQPKSKRIALWNPTTAANWSLIFTPIFGALIVSKNWEMIGDDRNATINKRWAYNYIIISFILSLAILISTDFDCSFALPLRVLSGLIFLIYLGSWYSFAAKKQVEYIKESYGKSYTRKSWVKPLGIATVCYATLLSPSIYSNVSTLLNTQKHKGSSQQSSSTLATTSEVNHDQEQFDNVIKLAKETANPNQSMTMVKSALVKYPKAVGRDEAEKLLTSLQVFLANDQRLYSVLTWARQIRNDARASKTLQRSLAQQSNTSTNQSPDSSDTDYAKIRIAAEIRLHSERDLGGSLERNIAAEEILSDYVKNGNDMRLKCAVVGALAMSRYRKSDLQGGDAGAKYMREHFATSIPQGYEQRFAISNLFQQCWGCHGRGTIGHSELHSNGLSWRYTTCGMCNGTGKSFMAMSAQDHLDYFLREVWALCFCAEHPDIQSFLDSILEEMATLHVHINDKGEYTESLGLSVWGHGCYGAYNAMGYFIKSHHKEIDIQKAEELAVELGRISAQVLCGDVTDENINTLMREIFADYPSAPNITWVKQAVSKHTEYLAFLDERTKNRDQDLRLGGQRHTHFASLKEAWAYADSHSRQNSGALDASRQAAVYGGEGTIIGSPQLLERYKPVRDTLHPGYWTVAPFTRDQNRGLYDAVDETLRH